MKYFLYQSCSSQWDLQLCSFKFFHLRTLRCSKNNIKFRRFPKISKVTVYLPKPPAIGPGLKSEQFREFEGESYPVLEFKVEIQTLSRVKGCKLDFTLFFFVPSKAIRFKKKKARVEFLNLVTHVHTHTTAMLGYWRTILHLCSVCS